ERAREPIERLVADATAELGELAERRGVTLAFRSTTSAQAEVDRPKIVRVLQNLIGNALKFTPPGGQVEVRTAASGGEVLVSVEDSGRGLEEGDRLRVFEKWQQTESGRTRGGSGLGLAIARAIVEAHGGRIGAGDRLDGGRGARFWFALPAARAPAELEAT